MAPQILMNGLISASSCLLMALGFALIYRTARFFHFAHGIVFAASAYSTFLLVAWLRLPLWFSLVLGVVAGTAVGVSSEICVYRPLRRRKASPLVLLLASLGLYVALQNVLSMVFGDRTRSLPLIWTSDTITLLGARVTYLHLATMCISVVVSLALAVLLKWTRLGQAVRAVSEDPGLANVAGIDADRITLLAFAMGSALAGIAGNLISLDVDMTPSMGLGPLMMGIVAGIVGGMRSVLGIALGALLLGMAQHLGVWKISSQWQDAIAFFVLLAFLLVRPEGVMGKRLRKATA